MLVVNNRHAKGASVLTNLVRAVARKAIRSVIRIGSIARDGPTDLGLVGDVRSLG